MFPTLIDLGTHDLPLLGETRLALPTYGLLFAAGALLAWWWFMRRARTLGAPDDRLFNLSFYSLLAGIIGAKLMLVVIEWRTYILHPENILGTLRSAGVLAGGVVAGAAVFTLYARRHGLPLLPLLDAAVAPLALGQAAGRLGPGRGQIGAVPIQGAHRQNAPAVAAQIVAQAARLVVAEP